jgi:hypothetical protein
MARTTGTSAKGSKPRSAAKTNEKTNVNPRRSPRKRGHANLAEESDEEQQQPKLKTPSRSRTRKRSQAKAKEEADLAGANSPPEKSAEHDEDAFDPEVHDEEGDLGIIRKGRKNIEYDSDALDEEEDHKPKSSKKRKRGSDATGTPSPTKAKAPKRKKRKVVDEDEDEDEDEDLKEGQEVVGVVVQAPKSGRGALLFQAMHDLVAKSNPVQSHQAKSPRTRSTSCQSWQIPLVMTVNGMFHSAT